MVDRAALEMRSTRKRTGGSNPSLSAISPVQTIDIAWKTKTAAEPALVAALVGALARALPSARKHARGAALDGTERGRAREGRPATQAEKKARSAPFPPAISSLPPRSRPSPEPSPGRKRANKQ